MQASKGKLYGNHTRISEIAKIGGQCRFVWNYFLAIYTKTYRETDKFIVTAT